MRVLSIEELLGIHKLMSDKYGTSPLVRDISLVESALYSINATFGGEELYPTVLEKCARLAFALISNHAFVDGNKRIGVLAMLVMLDLSGVWHALSDEDIISVGMGVACGEMGYEDILYLLEEKCSV